VILLENSENAEVCKAARKSPAEGQGDARPWGDLKFGAIGSALHHSEVSQWEPHGANGPHVSKF